MKGSPGLTTQSPMLASKIYNHIEHEVNCLHRFIKMLHLSPNIFPSAHIDISLNSFQSICEYVCTALEIFQRTHFNKLYNVRE